METTADGAGREGRGQTKADLQGQAEGLLGNFMGGRAVMEGMARCRLAGGQGWLMLVPLDSLQLRSL